MRFSIIVPVYNAAPWLETCVRSVRAQTYADWELIMVDDGSSDDSPAIADALVSLEPRMRAVCQDHLGQYAARRRGIELAQGAYLLFLDSDDTIEPTALAQMDEVLRKMEPDLLLFTGKIIQAGTDTGRRFGVLKAAQGPVEICTLRKSLLQGNDLNSLCIKAFRRTLFVPNEAPSFCCGYGEDKAMLLEPVTRAKSVWYLPQPLYCYHHHPKSTMHSYGMDDIEDLLGGALYDRLEEYAVRWGLRDRHSRRAIAQQYLRTYLTVYYGLRRGCGDAEARRKLRHYPWGCLLRWRYFPAALAPGLRMKERLGLAGALLRL